jgi:hypothetical protein
VSDELANKIGSSKSFRDIKDIGNETKQICNKIEDNLKTIEGYRTSPNKEFTFRVWTKEKFERIVKPNGYKLIE